MTLKHANWFCREDRKSFAYAKDGYVNMEDIDLSLYKDCDPFCETNLRSIKIFFEDWDTETIRSILTDSQDEKRAMEVFGTYENFQREELVDAKEIADKLREISLEIGPKVLNEMGVIHEALLKMVEHKDFSKTS